MMTREEAIKVIEVAKAEVEWEAPLDYQIAFDLAMEALRQPAQQWIPVSERLPEDEGSYLVFGRCASDEDYYCFISYFDTGCEAFGAWVDMYDPVTLGYVDSDFCEQDCVLAWMPLPEPYKEENDNGRFN